MGCTVEGVANTTQIKIASLNYSGILLSPYEFYEKYDSDGSGNNDERSLSQIMKKIVKEEKQIKESKFEFDFGPFEKQWQKQRFSPLYVPTCGIKNNIHLMCQPEFKQEWDRIKQIHIESLRQFYEKEKKNDKGKLKQMDYHLQNLKTFDFLIYRAILEQIYTSNEETKELNTNFKKPEKFQLDAKKYKQRRKMKFRKSFLNEEEKIQKTLQSIQKFDLDIFFIQEASEELVAAIEKKDKTIRIVKSCVENTNKLDSESIILIRENSLKFPKFKSFLEENSRFTNNINHLRNALVKPKFLTHEQIASLNINNDSVVQFLYNILLVCPHLTSKQKQNEGQIALMKEKLAFFKYHFPDCHVILGGDLNNKKLESFDKQYVQDQVKKSFHFHVVPDCHQHFTSNKKRTHLQAQEKKAGQHKTEVKDYFISDLPIENAKIMTIDSKIIIDCEKDKNVIKQQLPLLPNNNHPYDHYLIVGKIKLPWLEHVTDKQYRYKYKPHQLSSRQLEEIQRSLPLQKILDPIQ